MHATGGVYCTVNLRATSLVIDTDGTSGVLGLSARRIDVSSGIASMHSSGPRPIIGNMQCGLFPKSRVQRWQLGRGCNHICRRRSAGAPRSQPCPFEYSKRFVCTCFDSFGLGDLYVSCYGKAWHRSEYVRSPMPSADSRDSESVRSTPAQVNRRLRLHLRFHNEYVVRSRHNKAGCSLLRSRE